MNANCKQQLGPFTLQHCILMAPLARSGLIPSGELSGALALEYNG
jgi:hypothetical protein